MPFIFNIPGLSVWGSSNTPLVDGEKSPGTCFMDNEDQQARTNYIRNFGGGHEEDDNEAPILESEVSQDIEGPTSVDVDDIRILEEKEFSWRDRWKLSSPTLVMEVGCSPSDWQSLALTCARWVACSGGGIRMSIEIHVYVDEEQNLTGIDYRYWRVIKVEVHREFNGKENFLERCDGVHSDGEDTPLYTCTMRVGAKFKTYTVASSKPRIVCRRLSFMSASVG